MRLLPYGDAAVLLELPDLNAVLGLRTQLERERIDGVLDIVPSARTVLIRFDPAVTSAHKVTTRLQHVRPAPSDPAVAETVEIPVVYDGEDLDQVAAGLGWTRTELVAAHLGEVWTAGFVGFAPGFAYLVPHGDWPEVPRRPEPRTAVPAGSVGLAGEYSGVYPRSSPGGWSLIGRTDARVWDLARDPPALLVPGTTVRFVMAR